MNGISGTGAGERTHCPRAGTWSRIRGQRGGEARHRGSRRTRAKPYGMPWLQPGAHYVQRIREETT